MTISVTITKSGVFDAYGIAMVIGNTYTVEEDFGKGLIQALKATDTDLSLVAPAVGQANLNDIIYLNAASIASPSAALLANTSATYALDVAPHTRYYSDGIKLVSIINSLSSSSASYSTNIIVNGDSLEARHFAIPNSSSSFTVSQTGGLATLRMANHAIAPGTVIRMGGWTDSRWNGNFTVLPSGLTSAIFTFNINASADSVPTSISPATSFYGQFTIPTQASPDGFYHWCKLLTGMDFGTFYNTAFGSRTTVDIANAFDTDVMPLAPGVLIQGGGTNDALQEISTAVSTSAMESIIQKALRAGFRMALLTTPPQTSTTTVANSIFSFNKSLKTLARNYKVPVFDWYSILADPTSSTGAVLTGFIDSSDGVHPTTLAHKALAERYVIPWLRGMGLGTPIDLVDSTGDTVGTLTSSSNILGAMAGTGGTIGGVGCSGQSLTGWDLEGEITGGAATTVGSVVTSPVNSAQRIVMSGTGGQVSFLGPSITTGYSAGDTLRFCGNINVKMPTSFTMVLQLRVIYSGNTFTVRPFNITETTNPFPAGNYLMTFESEPWTITSVAPSSIIPQVVILPTGAVTGTMEFSQWTVRRI